MTNPCSRKTQQQLERRTRKVLGEGGGVGGWGGAEKGDGVGGGVTGWSETSVRDVML